MRSLIQSAFAFRNTNTNVNDPLNPMPCMPTAHRQAVGTPWVTSAASSASILELLPAGRGQWAGWKWPAGGACVNVHASSLGLSNATKEQRVYCVGALHLRHVRKYWCPLAIANPLNSQHSSSTCPTPQLSHPPVAALRPQRRLAEDVAAAAAAAAGDGAADGGLLPVGVAAGVPAAPPSLDTDAAWRGGKVSGARGVSVRRGRQKVGASGAGGGRCGKGHVGTHDHSRSDSDVCITVPLSLSLPLPLPVPLPNLPPEARSAMYQQMCSEHAVVVTVGGGTRQREARQHNGEDALPTAVGKPIRVSPPRHEWPA